MVDTKNKLRQLVHRRGEEHFAPLFSKNKYQFISAITVIHAAAISPAAPVFNNIKGMLR
jgi:hypothetical protein